MKLFHISDLHLGKRLFEYSLIEDQKYILNRILELCETHSPDALIIAGDVYDKPVPPIEAVVLLDDFLCALSKIGVRTVVISGNHDSPERIAFASRLMEQAGITLSPVWDGVTEKLTLTDKFGEVDLYLLPFIKPSHVRRCFPELEIASYTDAVRTVIDNISLDASRRNVLITHQFVTGASRSDSEEVSVGGSDNVDASVFEDFDYVALGHIHSPQNIGSERIRYSGTPLKYSFSEATQEKSVTVAELRKKGDIAVSTLPLTPMRELREIRGSYSELTLRENYAGTATDDYLHITLTDEDDIPDAAAKLRVIYKNLMKLDYDNKRTRATESLTPDEHAETASPMELFCDLFEKQNGRRPDKDQCEYIGGLIEKIFERSEG